ncbi:MAG: hypothetical protein K2M91_06215 [Lachnospiraceae bacterium]|nr:hypothetical protein [Lachnospiraceae bacterium]
MDKARIYVDLNEMVTEDIVLLSKDDTKTDSEDSLLHESDLKFLRQLPDEIKKSHGDILILRECLMDLVSGFCASNLSIFEA